MIDDLTKFLREAIKQVPSVRCAFRAAGIAAVGGREARHGIAAWIAFYNSRRPHQALGHATPVAVWCDGVVDALAARSVDMMDDARALPTCPQPQKQQQTAALAA